MIILGYNSGKQIELHFRGFYQECLDEKIIKNDGSRRAGIGALFHIPIAKKQIDKPQFP